MSDAADNGLSDATAPMSARPTEVSFDGSGEVGDIPHADPEGQEAASAAGSAAPVPRLLNSPPASRFKKAHRTVASLLPPTVHVPRDRKAFRHTIKPLYFFSEVSQVVSHSKRPLLGRPKKKRVLLMGYTRLYISKADAPDVLDDPMVKDLRGVVSIGDASLGLLFSTTEEDSPDDLLLVFAHEMLRDRAIHVLLQLAVANLGTADPFALPHLFILDNGGSPRDVLRLSKEQPHIDSTERGRYLRRGSYPPGVLPPSRAQLGSDSPRSARSLRSRSHRRQGSVGSSVYSNAPSETDDPRYRRRSSRSRRLPTPVVSESGSDTSSIDTVSSWVSSPRSPRSPRSPGEVPRRRSVHSTHSEGSPLAKLSAKVSFASDGEMREGRRRSASAHALRSGAFVPRYEYDDSRRRCADLEAMVYDLRRELGETSQQWADARLAAQATSEAVRQQCEAERLLGLQQQIRILTSHNAALQSENTSLRLQLSHYTASSTLLNRQATHLRFQSASAPFYNTASPRTQGDL